MQRQALIAAGAAGPPEGVSGVLRRFGFSRIAEVPDRDAALTRMRDESFDLVVIPVDGIGPGELLSLERSIRKDPSISVIATAVSADSDLIVRSMRAGVHEFLVYPPNTEELAGSVERLMRRSPSPREIEHGELIAVYSGKGGLGSTSIAVNLAQAFSALRKDTRTALVDFVPNGGDVRVFLNLKPAYDINHVIAKGTQIDAELLDSVMTPCPGGVWALPTGDNAEEHELLDSSVVTAMLGVLRNQFAVTVADCEHHLSDATLSALDAANRIVLVTQLTLPSLRSTQRSINLFRRLGYDDAKVCVVVSRHQSGDVLTVKDAEELLQAKAYWKLPNDFKASSEAMTTGVPVVLSQPGSKLSRAYTDLARKLLGGRLNTEVEASQTGASRLLRMFRNDRGITNVP